MAHTRDKHWEFSLSEYDVRPVVVPVIEAAYTSDGDVRVQPKDHRGGHGDPIRRNEHRANLLAGFVQSQVWAGSVDFDHDPEHAEDPAVDRDSLARALARYFDGAHDAHLVGAVEPAQPLFNDDFADPAIIKVFIAALVDVIATAIAEGRIEVTADEPYGSCSWCGGYHNVNYDHRDDEEDSDDEDGDREDPDEF